MSPIRVKELPAGAKVLSVREANVLDLVDMDGLADALGVSVAVLNSTMRRYTPPAPFAYLDEGDGRFACLYRVPDVARWAQADGGPQGLSQRMRPVLRRVGGPGRVSAPYKWRDGSRPEVEIAGA